MWGMEGRTGAGAGLCHWGILVTSLEHKEKHEIYQERLHFTRSQNNDSFIAPQPGKKQLKMDLEGVWLQRAWTMETSFPRSANFLFVSRLIFPVSFA